MHKYKVVWVLQDGNVHSEEFEADIYQFHPQNPGIVLFLKEKKIEAINLVPQSHGPEGPPADIVGTAAGYLAIHLLS